MTNKEKAKEICHCSVCTYKLKSEGDNCMCPKMASILQAMEWKDEQWKKRLQDAFIGGWTASLDIDNSSPKRTTTISFVKEDY